MVVVSSRPRYGLKCSRLQGPASQTEHETRVHISVYLCADVCGGPANGRSTSTFLIRSTDPIWLLPSQLIAGEIMPGSPKWGRSGAVQNSNKRDGGNAGPSADESDGPE